MVGKKIKPRRRLRDSRVVGLLILGTHQRQHERSVSTGGLRIAGQTHGALDVRVSCTRDHGHLSRHRAAVRLDEIDALLLGEQPRLARRAQHRHRLHPQIHEPCRMLGGCLHIQVPTLVEQRQKRDANTTKDRRTPVSCHASTTLLMPYENPPISRNIQ